MKRSARTITPIFILTMQHTDRQDLIIYGSLALSFVAMLIFKSGDLIEGINAQSLVSRNAQATAKDDAIAQRRFSQGCNTGFVLANSNTSLIDGEIPLDAVTRSPIAPGAVLCDRTGATGIVSPFGAISDIRVSAKVRKTYIDKGLGEN